jgi:hypothetical protein
MLDMACGLIEHPLVVGLFLDHKEATIPFDDGGDGCVGRPAHRFHLSQFKGCTR